MFTAAGRWLPSSCHPKHLLPIFNTPIGYSGELEPMDGEGINYWLVVNQKLWELEIKRQPQATGIIYGSGAIFSTTHQRFWLLYQYWILIPASEAPFSWRLASLTHFICHIKAVRNEMSRVCLQESGVSHKCRLNATHVLSSQRSKTASEML